MNKLQFTILTHVETNCRLGPTNDCSLLEYLPREISREQREPPLHGKFLSGPNILNQISMVLGLLLLWYVENWSIYLVHTYCELVQI